MPVDSLIVYVYAALVIFAGIMGFIKAGSRPSLIAGVSGGLSIFFAARYARTRAVMPGWLMAILSLVAR